MERTCSRNRTETVPQIVEAALDSLVVSASNRDAETIFSFTTIASNYLGSTKQVGTLIGEVFGQLAYISGEMATWVTS